jgi:hypothetical protein
MAYNHDVYDTSVSMKNEAALFLHCSVRMTRAHSMFLEALGLIPNPGTSCSFVPAALVHAVTGLLRVTCHCGRQTMA